MGIDRHQRNSETEEHHDGRGLRSDAGNRGEPAARLKRRHLLEERQVIVAGSQPRRLQRRLDARCLLVREPAALDRARELTDRGALDRRPVGVPGAQRIEGARRVHVAGVLTQDRRDEFADRIESRLPPRRSIERLESGQHVVHETWPTTHEPLRPRDRRIRSSPRHRAIVAVATLGSCGCALCGAARTAPVQPSSSGATRQP